MKRTALILSLVLLALPMAASEERVAGPDGRLVVAVSDEGGMPTYSVWYDGVPFLLRSPLGLKTDIGDLTQGVRLAGWLKEGEKAISLSSVGYIINPTMMEAKPLLYVVGTGTVTIGDIRIGVTSSPMYIDCELQEAYNTQGVSRNSYLILTDGVFPVALLDGEA